jgi:UDP-glucose 4-epimerase
MTRFLLTLDQAVDTVFAAIRSGRRGDTYVPRAPSARVEEIADVMIGGRSIEKTFIGIRPGEKIHELMVSEEECYRTTERDGYYVICPMLPELQSDTPAPALRGEYSSEVITVHAKELAPLLAPYMGAPTGAGRTA